MAGRGTSGFLTYRRIIDDEPSSAGLADTSSNRAGYAYVGSELCPEHKFRESHIDRDAY